MNERMKHLAVQSGVSFLMQDEHSMVMNAKDLEKFAELIVKECIDIVSYGGEFASRPKLVEKIKEHFGVE